MTTVEPVKMIRITINRKPTLLTERDAFRLHVDLGSQLNMRPKPKSEVVFEAVCSRYNLTREQLLSRRRPNHIAWPRQVAMYLVRELTESTLQFTGELFNRDHGTVLHAWRTVHFNAKNVPKVGQEIEEITKQIEDQTK
jgi:chromosomal replication initiation ATPase DnaA